MSRRDASRTSFDHLVGAGEERRGNLKPERFRGPKIDDQFRFRNFLVCVPPVTVSVPHALVSFWRYNHCTKLRSLVIVPKLAVH
jgi:hypothetical protein